MEKFSKDERFGPTTTGTGRLLGKAGVLSPAQIDHLINGYFGWLGMHVLATADFAVRPLMDIPEKPAMRINDWFVIGDFVKGLPEYQSKYVTRLYDQGKKFQQSLNDYCLYMQTGQIQKAIQFQKDNATDIQLGMLYQHADRAMGQINAQIRVVQARDMEGEEKRARLDQLYVIRNQLAKTIEGRAREAQAQEK